MSTHLLAEHLWRLNGASADSVIALDASEPIRLVPAPSSQT